MSDLLAARLQMATSLAFHIVFAVVGIALPLMMVVAEALWLRTGAPVYRTLARRWAKGAAILFAVGAVSGTVLSFELGLLWPRFMGFAGSIIGLPFALEGFAFFTEAIFLGIYLSLTDKRVGFASFDVVGLDNFRRLLNDAIFRRTVANTLIYSFVTVPELLGIPAYQDGNAPAPDVSQAAAV